MFTSNMALLMPFVRETQVADFNVSDLDFSNHTNLWIRLPTHEIALKVLALLPIMVMGIFGNVAILVVMLRIKGMRTCTNIFICNMALADLMTILCCSWTIIVVDAYQNFILGKIYCKLDGFFHVTFLLASVFSLIIISGDRLLGIVFPFSRRLSRGQAWIIVVATWVAAMMCASPTAIWRWLQTRKWHDYEEVWCNENGFLLKYYWLMILILLVYMPLTVMAVAYTAIILQLDKYEHQLFLREHPLKMKYRKKLPSWYRKVYFPAHVLTYAQSAINPIIYGVCNESFRKAFRITFRCFFKKNKIRPTAAPNYVHSPQRANRPTVNCVNKNIFQNGQVAAPSTQETELKDVPDKNSHRKTRTSNAT
ncbi:substance-K receptor-like isoform X2 [Argiope bruennichi]|uniref:substance-K receptor-like isoform X2 n=1 Tax=Argiope bruennichi TaxID=94029 RepID=UPI00249486FC|nr:substance-K receptor-like isoform X2 [Argiope bruennichi]